MLLVQTLQHLSLCHELPLILADKIPEGDMHWYLLLKICSIAISPEVTHDTIAFLRDLIKEKLTLFTSIYANAKVLPKMHYLVHYPSQIESFGPLIHSWTMRHEALLNKPLIVVISRILPKLWQKSTSFGSATTFNVIKI